MNDFIHNISPIQTIAVLLVITIIAHFVLGKILKQISCESFVLYTEILRRVQLIGLQTALENQDILSNLLKSLRNLYSVLLNMNITIAQKLTILNDINAVWRGFKSSVYRAAYGRILVDNVYVLHIMKE